MDRPGIAVIDLRMDSCSNGGAVARPADQSDCQPVIPESRILKKGIPVAIPGVGPSQLFKDIEIAIVIEIGEGHRMTLLQVAESPCHRDI